MSRKNNNVQLIHLRINQKVYDRINNISEQTGDSIAEATRNLIDKGLAIEVSSKEMDLIAQVVREQLEIIIKPYMERLAAISAKGALMSAESTFLNVQALLDIVETSKRKNVLDLYEKARKRGVEFMQSNNGTDIRPYIKQIVNENEIDKKVGK